MCQTLIPAFGETPPGRIEGVNIPADLLQSTLERAAPQGRDAVLAAVGRLGLQPHQAEVLAAATRLDESAMAVAVVIDQVSASTASAGADGRRHRVWAHPITTTRVRRR